MDVAVFPYLYAIALVAVAWFLVWPRPRLTLTTYYLSVFALYHGPAFFTYHLESGFQPVFETLAAVLLLSRICFAAGQWLAEPSGRTAAASMRWLERRAENDRFATDILWAAVAVVGFVAAVNFIAYGAAGRLVTDVPNLCLARYFEFFPNVYDHTCGLNIRLIHGMLQWGDTYVPAHRLIDDNGANANAIYVADAWVDFSWPGVALASLLVGWTLGRLDAGLFARRSPLHVALFVALMAPVHALVSMSLITCFVGYGLVTLPWFARLLRLAEVGRPAAVTTALKGESRAAIQVS